MLHTHTHKPFESAYYLLGFVLGTNYAIKSGIYFKKFRSQQTLGGRHKVRQPRIKSHLLYQADVKQYRCCYFKVIWDNEDSTKFGLKKPKFKSQFTVYLNYYLGPISPLFWALLSFSINC